MMEGRALLEANQIGEFTSLIFMALALGMDVFSISLGMGMKEVRLKRVLIIGFVFGIFHLILPFIGIVIGSVLSMKTGTMATLIGGVLLIVIGSQMLLSVFTDQTKPVIEPVGFGLMILALSVSIDSFSVGLSLGLSGVHTIVALLLFAIVSTSLTWVGMFLGRKVRGLLGVYSEIFGGSILFGFGLFMIFG